MDAMQIRRAVAAGTAPMSAFLEGISTEVAINQVATGAREVRASLEGIDQPLAGLLAIPGVTDLLVNGPHEAWIDTGAGLEPVTDFTLPGGAAQLRAMAVRMAAAAGQRLDDATPIVDATLASGVRLHAVLPPLSGACTVISLRVPAPVALPLAELVKRSMLSEWMSEVLKKLVTAQVSGIISGATGTGKTTLLAALLGLVASTERLICIEEVSELRPNHPHVVHLQARAANVQNAGGVSLSDLVKAAMRMRPDRLILGEARGAEVREMLSALNTGHRGGWATLHANSALEVPARLEALGALAGMPRATVCAQALPAFDVIVQLQRKVSPAENGGMQVRRRVTQLARLCRGANGELSAEPMADMLPTGKVRLYHGWTEFARNCELPQPSHPIWVDSLSPGGVEGRNTTTAPDTPSRTAGRNWPELQMETRLCPADTELRR